MTETSHLTKTYHDSLEAAYFGKARNFHGIGVSVQITPLKNQRALMDNLVSIPSYHFGQMLNVFVKADWAKPDMQKVCEYMVELRKSRMAIVFGSNKSEDTCIVTFDLTRGVEVAISIAIFDTTGELGGAPGSWLAFPGKWVGGTEGWPFIGLAIHGLELLANQKIEYEMAEPPTGVAKMAAGRERRGEVPVAPMKIVHLTKRVRINGHVIAPTGSGSGSEKSPHTREGHYRHSKRPITGWEGPIIETSGEWEGVECYRRWIDDVEIKGGAPGLGREHPKAAQPKAPQFRVVK